jgi:sterol desaturase/sphingolipid hydroxylase (fatty acid hydroxylase superfamily)
VRGAFRHLFVPLLLTAAVLAWRLHVSTLVVFVSTLALIFVAEQLFPARRAWNYGSGVPAVQRFSRDFFYVMVVTQVTVLLIALVSKKLEALVPPQGWWLGGPLSVPLAFLMMELCNYGFHRAAHRVPLLWRFHATHHVITELTGVKSLRTHPIDNVFFHVVRTVPLMLLGAPADDIAAATYFGAVLGILSHANLDLAPGVLGWVINFPRFHAVHHALDARQAQANFGCHTVLWDRVFRTFDDGENAPVALGVKTDAPRSVWRELYDAR